VLTYRVRNIGIAAALALLAAVFTFFYVSNYKQHVQQGEELVDVYVASHDIEIGTSGPEAAGSLTHKRVARTAVVPGAISSPDQIEKLFATQPIFTGEQVSTKRFQPVEEQGIRGQLRGTQRALEVPGDAHQLLLGTLHDGDRVDVVGSWSEPEGQQVHVSKVFLRDIKVLHAPSQSEVAGKLGASAQQPYAAILALSDLQAKRLFWMMKNGEWSLQLRPVAKAKDSAEDYDTGVSILRAGLKKGVNHP
jgi:Flp pilus assembly protein CpaB